MGVGGHVAVFAFCSFHFDYLQKFVLTAFAAGSEVVCLWRCLAETARLLGHWNQSFCSCQTFSKAVSANRLSELFHSISSPSPPRTCTLFTLNSANRPAQFRFTAYDYRLRSYQVRNVHRATELSYWSEPCRYFGSPALGP